MSYTSSQIMDLICTEVNSIKKHELDDCDVSSLAPLTIEELELTSLDVLEVIMNLEESLEMDIDVEFSANTTMFDLSNIFVDCVATKKV